MSKPIAASESRDSELSLEQLRGHCIRMAPHWAVPAAAAAAPVPPSLIHGVVVPAVSARMLGALSGYGA
ncbi:hypothetical protein ACRAR1_22165 [Streptomyces sanyensis]|uniref:hypothetical protein n=1 Tax=Streptomyces sanyensis TaxID=568869 RepID=UPI003D78247D